MADRPAHRPASRPGTGRFFRRTIDGQNQVLFLRPGGPAQLRRIQAVPWGNQAWNCVPAEKTSQWCCPAPVSMRTRFHEETASSKEGRCCRPLTTHLAKHGGRAQLDVHGFERNAQLDYESKCLRFTLDIFTYTSDAIILASSGTSSC